LEDARGYLESHGIAGTHSKTFSKITPAAKAGVNGHDKGQGLTDASNGTTDENFDGHASEAFATNSAVNGHVNSHISGQLHESAANDDSRSRLFLMSGFDESAGKSQAKNLSHYLTDRLRHADGQFMHDLAYTLGERRSRLAWKAVVTANSAQQLIDRLDDAALKFTKSTAKPGLAFVFTGQGAQWHAMGWELMKAYPVFLNTLIKAGKYLKGIGASWDLIGIALPQRN